MTLLKQIVVFLFIIILFSSFDQKDFASDVKEYGFRGAVKSVKMINYGNVERQDENWILSESKIQSKQHMSFDETGNIIDMNEFYLMPSGFWYEVSTNYTYFNGRKKSYIKTDIFGQQTETGNYVWLDYKHYELKSTQINGNRVESKTGLNNNFRSVSGGYNYYQNESIVASENYENVVDKNGEIIRTNFLNNITGVPYSIEYKTKKFDHKGNLIQVALIFSGTEKLKRLVVREFEYYEDDEDLIGMKVEPDHQTKEMINRLSEAVNTIDVARAPYILNKKKVDLFLEQFVKSSGVDRVGLMYLYGLELLKSGKNEQSLTVFNQVLEESKRMQINDIDEFLYTTKKQLAIAYMRKAEQENCIANHSAESCIIPFSVNARHILKSGSEKSIQILNELLAIQPNDYECQYLLNIAHMTLGQYPEMVPEDYRIPESYFNSSKRFSKFSDIAKNLGVDDNKGAGGTCVDDFNNDGYLDIIASSWGFNDQIKYYENDGRGGFVDKTNSTGLTGVTGGLNLQHADYNNDGNLDFIILRGAWLEEMGNIPNSLIRNNGDGTFTDVTIESGLYSLRPTQTAVWRDFDLDGWLDIFIANESSPAKKNNCELYLNNGDGTFSDVALEAGISETGFFKGVSSGDFNNDRLPDLYVSNYSGENILYLNRSNSEKGLLFEMADKKAGISGPDRSFPTWIFDFDNDGFEDIFVSGYSTNNSTPAHLMMENIKSEKVGHKPKLFKNYGDGTFGDVSSELGLTEPVTTMGCNFGDLDNDGFLDFYLATGDPNFFSIVPNRMYRNNRGDNFEDITYSAGFGHIQKGHAIGFGDLDMDGDQDIYTVMGGAYEGDNYTNILFENPIGNKNNWINIVLEGKMSNRSAIGARIVLTIEENGSERKIYHTVGTGASFGGNSLMAEIGVGQSKLIKTIEINWPHLTKNNSFFNSVKVNQTIKIKEESSTHEVLNYRKLKFNNEANHHH
jgi:tetratricopeptide (TPR) repeat protein